MSTNVYTMNVKETSLSALMAEAETETPTVTEPKTIEETTVAQPEAAAEQPAEETVAEAPLETNFSEWDLPEETPDEVTAEAQPKNWKELLKTIDKKEILAELGVPELDDFEKGFIEARRKGVDPYKYIEAKAIDYTAIADEDLIRADFKKQYPDANEKQIERLINKKYNQGELAEDEDKEDGLLLMKADARRLRQQLINDQKNFTIPAYAQPEQAEVLQQIAQQEAAQQQQAAAVAEYINTSDVTKKILTDKAVSVDLGDGQKFNFKLKNPQALLNLVLNPEQSRKLTQTQDGKLDTEALFEVALFLSNRQKFKRDLVNYGKTLKLDEQVAEGQNAGIPPVRPTAQSQVSDKEAWKNAQTVPLGQLLRN